MSVSSHGNESLTKVATGRGPGCSRRSHGPASGVSKNAGDGLMSASSNSSTISLEGDDLLARREASTPAERGSSAWPRAGSPAPGTPPPQPSGCVWRACAASRRRSAAGGRNPGRRCRRGMAWRSRSTRGVDDSRSSPRITWVMPMSGRPRRWAGRSWATRRNERRRSPRWSSWAKRTSPRMTSCTTVSPSSGTRNRRARPGPAPGPGRGRSRRSRRPPRTRRRPGPARRRPCSRRRTRSRRRPAAAATSMCRSTRSDWRTGPSSQSMPSHRRPRTMASKDSSVERAASVSSMRSRSDPPVWRA